MKNNEDLINQPINVIQGGEGLYLIETPHLDPSLILEDIYENEFPYFTLLPPETELITGEITTAFSAAILPAPPQELINELRANIGLSTEPVIYRSTDGYLFKTQTSPTNRSTVPKALEMWGKRILPSIGITLADNNSSVILLGMIKTGKYLNAVYVDFIDAFVTKMNKVAGNHYRFYRPAEYDNRLEDKDRIIIQCNSIHAQTDIRALQNQITTANSYNELAAILEDGIQVPNSARLPRRLYSREDKYIDNSDYILLGNDGEYYILYTRHTKYKGVSRDTHPVTLVKVSTLLEEMFTNPTYDKRLEFPQFIYPEIQWQKLFQVIWIDYMRNRKLNDIYAAILRHNVQKDFLKDIIDVVKIHINDRNFTAEDFIEYLESRYPGGLPLIQTH